MKAAMIFWVPIFVESNIFVLVFTDQGGSQIFGDCFQGEVHICFTIFL